MSALISGIGWVSSGGLGQARRGDRFSMETGELPTVGRKDVFDRPDRAFGRLDPFSRMGLAAIAFALADAGLDSWESKRPIGQIAGTTYGCLQTDSDYFDTVLTEEGRLASPQLFAYTLSNTFLGESAIRFGLTGASLVASAPDPSGLAPLRMALENIAWGEEAQVVAGICDLTPPSMLGALPSPPPGALFMVLERDERDGFPPLGRLRAAGAGELWCDDEKVESLQALAERAVRRAASFKETI